MNHRMNRRPLLCLLLLFLGSVAWAGDLQPYTATYKARMGMLTGTSTEQLAVGKNGGFELTQNLDALVASIEERSLFRLHEGRVRPDRYDYSFSALLKERRQRELFDWEGSKVTHTYKGETRVQTLPAGTQDRITSRLQLRRDIAAGEQDLTYQVAQKGRIREFRFAVIGQEQLQTPLGKLDTLKVTRVRDADSERKTYLWLAPALDYLLVRLQQIEEDDSELVLELQSTSLQSR